MKGVFSSLEAIAHLLLKLNIYATGGLCVFIISMLLGMVRLRISEIQPLHVRHEIPPGDVVSDPPPRVAQVTTKDEAGKTIFKFAVDGVDIEALEA